MTRSNTTHALVGFSRVGRRGVSLTDVLFGLVVIASLGVVIYAGQRNGGGDTSLATGMFDRSVSYSEVADRAAAAGKPVFVFATADWCGPCQSFKGGTLSDADVQASLTGSTELYYLDVTDQGKMSEEDRNLAAQLNVGGIPAYYVVDDGEIVARGSGAVGVDQFTSWLDGAVGSR